MSHRIYDIKPNMHSSGSTWILTAFHKTLACIHVMNIQYMLTLLQGSSLSWEEWKKDICMFKNIFHIGEAWKGFRCFHYTNKCFFCCNRQPCPSPLSLQKFFLLSSLTTSVIEMSWKVSILSFIQVDQIHNRMVFANIPGIFATTAYSAEF